MRLRRRNPAPRPLEVDEPGLLDHAPAPVAAGVAAAGAAATSAAIVLALVIVAWLVAASAGTSGAQVAKIGLDGWLLAQGGRLHAGSATVSMTPWLLSLLPFATLRWGAHRAVAAVPRSGGPRREAAAARRDLLFTGAAFVGVYVVVAACVSLLGRFDGLYAGLPSSMLGAFCFSTVAYMMAVRSVASPAATAAGGPANDRVPTWLRRAVAPAALGVVGLLLAGALLTLVVVGLSYPRVARLYGYVDAGIVGSVLLTVGQVAYLPTAAAWAVSFVAGPGFTVGSGSSVTWTTSEAGPFPLIPVLGALPDPGPMPQWVAAFVAVPVLIGVFVGWRCVRRCPRRASWAERARTVAAGVLLVAAAMTVVGVATSGSLGSGRLAHLGVNAPLTAAALTGELGAGAALSLLASGLRGRHIRPVEVTDPAN